MYPKCHKRVKYKNVLQWQLIIQLKTNSGISNVALLLKQMRLFEREFLKTMKRTEREVTEKKNKTDEKKQAICSYISSLTKVK